MKDNYKNILIVLLLLAVGYLLWSRQQSPVSMPPVEKTQPTRVEKKDGRRSSSPSSIQELTSESTVVPFVKQNGRLPNYYLTKSEARKLGWNAGAGNLCDILPGRAIGGDVFTNRQKLLPVKSGRRWYEADLNYDCGRRNADRLLFSNDGLVYVTHDHYQTVEEK